MAKTKEKVKNKILKHYEKRNLEDRHSGRHINPHGGSDRPRNGIVYGEYACMTDER
jgi:hypothetical protein